MQSIQIWMLNHHLGNYINYQNLLLSLITIQHIDDQHSHSTCKEDKFPYIKNRY